MVKWIQFKTGTGKYTNRTYKVSEREYQTLLDKGEKLKVVDSVTRKRKNPNNWFDFGNW